MASIFENARLENARGGARRAIASLLLGSLLVTGTAQATIVERVVAVVGDKAILLSDLHQRARPMAQQIYKEVPDGASRNAALSQMYRQLADRLIDEELQAREAVRANISVTAPEIERGIELTAKQNGLEVQELYAEVQRSGMSVGEYRQQMRLQLLDFKMGQLRTQGRRMGVSEDDMRASYRRMAEEERRTLQFRAAWIRFQIPVGSAASDSARVRQTAARVVAQARAGGDFAELARAHSSDLSTKEQGGLLAPMQPGQLPPEVDKALLSLEPGEVTEPILLGDAWLVLKLVERSDSALPPYEEAKEQLQARVYSEKMAGARRQWLDSLRKRTHVDLRL
jgi:peptidyl-prolyl cis-trans isomerase SurA